MHHQNRILAIIINHSKCVKFHGKVNVKPTKSLDILPIIQTLLDFVLFWSLFSLLFPTISCIFTTENLLLKHVKWREEWIMAWICKNHLSFSHSYHSLSSFSFSLKSLSQAWPWSQSACCLPCPTGREEAAWRQWSSCEGSDGPCVSSDGCGGFAVVSEVASCKASASQEPFSGTLQQG